MKGKQIYLQESSNKFSYLKVPITELALFNMTWNCAHCVCLCVCVLACMHVVISDSFIYLPVYLLDRLST